jgi:DNA repair ATPase
MDEERKKAIEELEYASPLEISRLLQEMELYDEKTSQEVLDEVHEKFDLAEHLEDEVLKPVFMSVIDGLLEATSGGRAARKKGLTASRVVEECTSFSYDDLEDNHTNVNGYTEYKNINHDEIEYQVQLEKWKKDGKNGDRPQYNGSVNSNSTQEYVRSNLEDSSAMNDYKEKQRHGEKKIKDEYTGKDNLYVSQNNMPDNYNDETHRKQAQPDHIVPLKQLHEQYKHNYALDDSDLKRIANSESNLAITSAEINQVKRDMTNKQYIEWMDEHGKPLDENTKKIMLQKQKEATKSIESDVNKTVAKNLVGKGQVDEKAMKNAVNEFKENNGQAPTEEQRNQIEQNLIKKKTNEIRGTAVKNAAGQAKDYAVGNLILFIVKPIYYEISDIFKNGLKEGVGADSGSQALGIRFTRVKKYVMTHAKAFFGDSILDFVKGFVSSLIEGIISLFVGMLKQVLKILKEGVKILVGSVQILFGKNAKAMSPAQKGDAIIKLIGGSVIAISGVALESLLNKIGIGDPWSVVLSTMLSGIASALFMYILNKADLFSTKAERRYERVKEIFDERIKDVQEATELFDRVALETMKEQRLQFESIQEEINTGLESNDIDSINTGLYKLADFMKVDLPYSNTKEFCDYMDSEEVLVL